MDVGLIKDRRPFEHRIGLTPGGVRALTDKGHRVYLESGAGREAGFSNHAYTNAGAIIAYSDEEVGLRSQMLIRLSPPTTEECESYQPGQIVISAWHLAVASEDYFKKVLEGGVTTVGYEILEDDEGHAPVLEAMSEIAGRLAVTIGAGLVLNDFGGKGLLIGRAGHSAGDDGDPRRRYPRLRGGEIRAGHRRPRGGARQEHQCIAPRTEHDPRRDPDDGGYACTDRKGARLCRHSGVLGGGARRADADPGHPRHAQTDETAFRHHGSLDRSRRVLRDLAAHRFFKPHLRG